MDNAGEILDGLDGDEFDLVTTVSAEMPLRVLADLFGMPREDRHLIFDWSNALLGADNPNIAQHADEAMVAMAAMMELRPGHGGRPSGPAQDDIVSRIVNAEVDGERLSGHRVPDVLAAPRRGRQRDHPERTVGFSASPSTSTGSGHGSPSTPSTCRPRSTSCCVTSRPSSSSAGPRCATRSSATRRSGPATRS